MISSTEVSGSAFSPVSTPKSPSCEVDEERDVDIQWRPGNPSQMHLSRHFWSVWGPYSSPFGPSAMDHVLKPTSPPIWPMCGSFGSPVYPSFWKERFSQFRFAPYSDEEKPSQSYIGLIAEAILSSPEEKLILSDIYNYILTHYPYFRNKGTGWRNSIRHNLSLNDCFVKAGRSPNGKGHFWAISSLYYEDFRRGDFRRRRIQKRSHKSRRTSSESSKEEVVICKAESSEEVGTGSEEPEEVLECTVTVKDEQQNEGDESASEKVEVSQEKRKSFDMASLLAPDRGQRETGLVLPVYSRPFEASLVYNSYPIHSGGYLPQVTAYDRHRGSESTKLIFPYNYRLAC
ncbi:forkhead box protein Q1-like [Montipora capricornis]|uniref:forkhead box protein Q1-like n=1 Tax=Montipora capricornis TaxID=246305 RepID=UPI0035F1F1B0